MELRNRQLSEASATSNGDTEQPRDDTITAAENEATFTAAGNEATFTAATNLTISELKPSGDDAFNPNTTEHSAGDINGAELVDPEPTKHTRANSDGGSSSPINFASSSQGGDNDDEGGGFFGDFEEIEEDEDVERLISQNHTPLPTAPHSPVSITGEMTQDSAAESTDDESFEAIPPTNNHLLHSIADSAHPFDQVLSNGSIENGDNNNNNINRASLSGDQEMAQSHAPEPPETTADTQVPSTADRSSSPPLAGLKDSVLIDSTQPISIAEGTANETAKSDQPNYYDKLQSAFIKSLVPELPSGLFLDFEVYRKYSCVLTQSSLTNTNAAGQNAEATNNWSPSPAPISLPQPQARPPKPSSLRNSAKAPNEMDSATARSVDGNVPKPADTELPKRTNNLTEHQRSNKPALGSHDDDVVGTLLGAMKPTIAAKLSPQPPPASGDLRSNAQLPDDMLVALQAATTGTTDQPQKQPQQPQQQQQQQKLDAKALAEKLPKGYDGPFSQLTLAQHSEYLRLASQAQKLTNKEATDLQRLKTKVDAEQQKYRLQEREAALPRLSYIREGIKKFTRDRSMAIAKNAGAVYPDLYVSAKSTSVRSVAASAYVPFIYKDTLVQRGICYRTKTCKEIDGQQKVPEADPWKGSNNSSDPAAVSHDQCAAKITDVIGPDVVVSDTALAAMLTLPQTYKHDIVIPVVVSDSLVDGGDGGKVHKRIAFVDDPLVPASAMTPRKLNQMYYETAVREAMFVDASESMELAGGSLAHQLSSPATPSSDASKANLNYTLWQFGGLSVVIRYRVDGFSPDAAAENGSGQSTTVTLKTKLEYHHQGSSEPISDAERLSWWLAAYLRGNRSEVWVPHIDILSSTVSKVNKYTVSDLFPDSTSQPAANPPATRGVLELLLELLKLSPGNYMIVHRRRMIDATIYRAISEDDSAAMVGTSDVTLDLVRELGDGDALDVEADYVPVTWRGLPGQIPFTYPPADLAEFCPSPATAWKQQARKRKRSGGGKKRKNKNK